MNIYVGNLAYGTTDDQLKDLFVEFGEVESAKVIIDRATGRSKGFGFVVMPDNAQAQQAIESLNEKEFGGRPLRINEARERTEAKPFRSGPRQ
jgi:RNA recognition motif-containing protein